MLRRSFLSHRNDIFLVNLIFQIDIDNNIVNSWEVNDYNLLRSYLTHDSILVTISKLNNLDDSITVRDILSKENFDALSLLENIEKFNDFVNELGEYCINDDSEKSSLFINDSTSISELRNLESNIKNSCQKAEKLISIFNAKEKQRLLKKISDND